MLKLSHGAHFLGEGAATRSSNNLNKLGFTLAENTTCVDTPPRFAKLGFTLAEILITLGIIGVVAAMTIPNLVVKYQKAQTVSRLKSVYSQLQQAIKLSEVDNDDITGWDFDKTGVQFFEQYILPYMKNISKVDSKTVATHQKYKQSSGEFERGLRLLSGVDSVQIYTNINGIQIFRNANSDPSGLIVDLNGFAPPNQFGKDLFYFVITKKRGLYPMGIYSTNEYTFETEPNHDREVLRGAKAPKSGGYNYPCSKTGRGMWCAALIMVDGWQIKDDYPW